MFSLDDAVDMRSDLATCGCPDCDDPILLLEKLRDLARKEAAVLRDYQDKTDRGEREKEDILGFLEKMTSEREALFRYLQALFPSVETFIEEPRAVDIIEDIREADGRSMEILRSLSDELRTELQSNKRAGERKKSDQRESDSAAFIDILC